MPANGAAFNPLVDSQSRPLEAQSRNISVYATFRARTSFRKNLADACRQRPDLCVFYESEDGRPEGQTRYLIKTREFTRRAVFCLQPPGDTPSRREFWESLLLGCIPVVFEPRNKLDHTFSDRLPWHDMVVTIHQERGVLPFNVVDVLRMIPAPRVARMQRTIARHTHLMQYALVPSLPPPSKSFSAWSSGVERGWSFAEAVVFQDSDDALTALLKEFVVKSLLAIWNRRDADDSLDERVVEDGANGKVIRVV
ncbi:hypothetical protein HDU83_009601 [Entophlyctis luteolus]|nr:hypothetical protein HDU83_009601 [Entophlyctis luteolus]